MVKQVRNSGSKFVENPGWQNQGCPRCWWQGVASSSSWAKQQFSWRRISTRRTAPTRPLGELRHHGGG